MKNQKSTLKTIKSTFKNQKYVQFYTFGDMSLFVGVLDWPHSCEKDRLTPNPDFQMCLWKCVSPIPKTCDHFWYKTIQPPWPRKDSLFSRTILRARCDQSMVGPSRGTHIRTSTMMLNINYTAILSTIAAQVWYCVPLMRN